MDATAYLQIKPTKINLSLFGRFPARAGTDEVYREFRTNRRPLNVASVVSRTVEQETSSVPALAGTGGIDGFRWGFDAWVVCCCANGYHTEVNVSTP